MANIQGKVVIITGISLIDLHVEPLAPTLPL